MTSDIADGGGWPGVVCMVDDGRCQPQNPVPHARTHAVPGLIDIFCNCPDHGLSRGSEWQPSRTFFDHNCARPDWCDNAVKCKTMHR